MRTSFRVFLSLIYHFTSYAIYARTMTNKISYTSKSFIWKIFKKSIKLRFSTEHFNVCLSYFLFCFLFYCLKITKRYCMEKKHRFFWFFFRIYVFPCLLVLFVSVSFDIVIFDRYVQLFVNCSITNSEIVTIYVCVCWSFLM